MMSRTPKLAAVAVLAAFSGLALQVQAQETVELDEVKVTAGRVEQELMDVNMSVSVITQEEIRRSSARNVGELLEDIPGVRINNDGGQGMKRIKIRGEDAFRTLVMIDGQKVSEHKSMSGSPMLIDPSMIERIEVIKGPASVLYGSDAIGGAINIITKKGGTKPIEGEVSAGMNTSASGKNASGSIYGGIDGWKYRLSASIEDNDNLKTPKGEMENTYFTARSVSGFLSYDFTPDATVGASLDYYDLEFGSSDVNTPGFAVDVPKWTRFKAAAFGEFKNITSSFVRLRTDIFYQKSKKDMTNTVPGVWTQGEVDTFKAMGFEEAFLNRVGVQAGNAYVLQPHASNDMNQYGFSIQADWQIGDRNYLIAGYEISYDDLNAHSWNTGTNVMPMMLTDKNYDGYQMTNAVYASMETLLSANLTLTYGARYTWVKTDMDSINNKMGTKTSGEGSDGKIVFNAGVLWHGTDNLTLRASYAQGYRSPILQELYIDTSMGSTGTTYANPDLKPETSDNFEIGARWNSTGLSADLAIFYSTADDYIATLYNAQKRGYQYNNVAEAKTFGVELTSSVRIAETGFEPYLTATWMRRQYQNGNGFSTYDTATPEFMLRYGVRWSGMYAGLGLRADAFARSQTEIEYDDGVQSATDSSSYRLGGYTTLNLTAGVDFGPKRQYSFDLGLYNIFDKGYQEQTSIYEPGRYFVAKLGARF
jgi:hemoglobin/transferrin/lactoferrin receptor protein